MTMPNAKLIRGYISSRPINGDRVAQHIQNLVVRDYAARKGLTYQLSATEYASLNCFQMLEATVNGIGGAHGIVMYSMYMLPRSARHRHSVYDRMLNAGKVLYAAAEDIRVADAGDIDYLETLLRLNACMQPAPGGLPVA
tara:strand:- start:7880 stop:8299 length:420 start_codon:yes stop_codon:yes gene_type:complete